MFNFGGSNRFSQDTKLYDALGISKGATHQEIKKSYRKLAKQHHPDRGGDTKKFKSVAHAYNILSDSDKRKMYDQFGVTDSQNVNTNHPKNMFDMFHSQEKTSTEDIVFPLKVNLEDLYQGATRKLRVTIKKICVECVGKGGQGQSIVCVECQGKGKRVKLVTIAPGMFQKSFVDCTTCNATGNKLSDLCITCKGKGTAKHQKTISVMIHKGMTNGQRITYPEEADEAINKKPGNIIIVLQQNKHHLYERKNENLFCDVHINIQESLCGFTKTIPFFNHKKILLVQDDIITAPEHWFKAAEYGMPVFEEPFRKGSLFVRFILDFPTSLTSAQKNSIRQVFPLSSPSSNVDDNTESVKLQLQSSEYVRQEKLDSTGPSTQCQTQ
jgi:DnaJ family protein A protein 2